jgi:cellulose synthase/poly-beta-1,6-N-acetylglucosamine synthase-like glycosyltransferase
VKQETKKEYFARRAFEILPGLTTWVTIIAIFPLSYFAPVFVSLFVILYDLSWLIKIVHISTHLIYSYGEVRKNWKTDYIERLEGFENIEVYKENLKSELSQIRFQLKNKQFSISRFSLQKQLKDLDRRYEEARELSARKETLLSWHDVYHVVIFPTAKESFEVLDTSLQAVLNADYPKDKIIIVMAFEDRAGELARENSRKVHEKYDSKFFMIHSSFHPSNIPGEIKAKSSNMTYAMRMFEGKINDLNIPKENIVVSAFDSDTQASKEYFGCLTYHYVKNPNRTRASYQPIPVYHNNIWDVPAIPRVTALSSTFWQMIEASRPQRLITFSSHAMSYKALVEVDYWPVNVISEDSQIFWRCYLHYNSEYYVEPMFTTVSMDAAEADTYWKTYAAQYNQKKRWFWGIENFPYISLGFLKNKNISWHKKLSQWLRMLDSFYTLATAPIILAFGGWLPVTLGGKAFQQNVVSQNLINLTSILTGLALTGLVTTFVISMLIVPARPNHKTPLLSIGMMLQWLLVPIVTIFFGSIPAIDSQTRLMTGRYIGEFWVSDKPRKGATAKKVATS